MRIEVHDFKSIALRSPLPPEKVVSVLAVDDCRQRVTDIVVEGAVLKLQREVGPLVAVLEVAVAWLVLRWIDEASCLSKTFVQITSFHCLKELF